MSVRVIPKKTNVLPPVVLQTPCKCGCIQFREANRIYQSDGRTSVMYECVECGEYRL